MVFNIDTGSSVPIYVQIITQVKRRIASGALRPGDALPSLRELASHLRVNPLTIARGYRELETAGIVVTEQGRGTFISDGAPAIGEEYKREALDCAADRMLVEAQQLGASPDEIRSVIEERLSSIFTSEAEVEQK